MMSWYLSLSLCSRYMSSSPAFGACSSSSFGSNSVFGQKTTFGGFGSTPNQSNPFGSTFQQTQSAFGSIPFGFTAFGTSSQASFGASSTPGFGSSSTPTFGVTSTPAFCPAFGSTNTPAFGSIPSPLPGNTGTTCGVSAAPAFGSTATPAFGAQSTSLFGSSSTPAFGAASTPAFGSSTTASGASSAPSFSFGSTSFTVRTTFTATTSTFIAQSSAFGGANFSGQPTSSVSSSTPAQANPFGSTSTFGQPPANPAQANLFGSRSTFGQPPASPAQANPFDSRSTFGQPSAPTNPFGFSSTFGIGTSSPSPFTSTFGSSPSKLFSSTSSTTSLLGTASNTAFGSISSSNFSGVTSAFSSSSTFGSTTGSSSTFSSGMNFGSTQSSGLFQSSTLSMGWTPSPFGQPTRFQQTIPAFGSNLFSTASTGCGGNLFGSSASVSYMSNPVGFAQAARSLSTPFQPSVPAQTSSAFSLNNFGQMQPVSTTESGHAKERNNTLSSSSSSSSSSSCTTERINGVTCVKDNHADKETDFSDTKMSDHKVRRAAAAVVCESRAGIETLLPKLHHADYYTEPGIQELASKEQAEPGFCCRVKDFVVGRRGFGSIKFSAETDVRNIDLESIVEFNNREVIVYKEGSKKPRVGRGLNKPAEVTLLNIKCIDKSTGVQYTEGPKVEILKEMLIKKAKEQGAEFVSYDAVNGEWKFRVKHFSSYEFGDGDSDVSFL